MVSGVWVNSDKPGISLRVVLLLMARQKAGAGKSKDPLISLPTLHLLEQQSSHQ
jgi:hypothetical protein